MPKRTRNLVTRLTEDELEMARQLAEARDEPMTVLLRRLLRIAYVERFGVTPPPQAAK
jgi:hypothetical protein